MSFTVRRPDEPSHLLTATRARAVARVGEVEIARSADALVVREAHGREYPAVVYFPANDVPAGLLRSTETVTSCPLKGRARALDVVIEGQSHGSAAWTYFEVHDFGPGLEHIRGQVAFDTRQVEVSFDEGAP